MKDNNKETFKRDRQQSIGHQISALYRYSRIYIEKEVEELGIGSGQFPFLHALFHEDGINQEALTQKLNVDKATTTRAIEKLIKSGYVRREVDEEDRRAYRVYLTPKGMRVKPKVIRILKKWTETLLSDFTDKEKKQLFELIKKMKKNASEFVDYQG